MHAGNTVLYMYKQFTKADEGSQMVMTGQAVS